MDKETLSNYGWIVICVLVLAVMLALATPFGSFIAGAIKSTTAGLFNVNQAALGSAGIDVNDMVFENCDHLETEIRNATDTYTGDTCCKACGAVLQAGQTVRAKVPEGGKYTAADGTVYEPGDEMPETVTTGDIYRYGDYIYTYKATADATYHVGWQVDINTAVTNKKQTSYGAILESINDEPVTNMNKTFFNCTKLTSITIPESVTNMRYTFQTCTSLVTAPAIPSSVTSMNGTFSGCKSLTIASVIPNSVTSLSWTFENCTSLKTYAGSATSDGDFSGYVIPNSVTEMNGTFSGCTSLVTAPAIPSSVTGVSHIFSGCTSLVTAPIIPESVGIIQYAFKDCTSLTGTITINGAIRSGYYDGCFANVDFEAQNITLEGSTTLLNAIGLKGKNYCTTCHGKCQGNH